MVTNWSATDELGIAGQNGWWFASYKHLLLLVIRTS
jgi:hypothetical protein